MANKKSTILFVLKVLTDYSDKSHYLTHQDIIEKVIDDYNISIERKSVANSIMLLQEVGYDIKKSPKGGYALLNRKLDDTDITYIADALFNSKSISARQAVDLIERISSSQSIYERKSYSYLHKANDNSRAGTKETFNTLELIEEAKYRHKKISFQYVSYNEEGKKEKRNAGKRYMVSPYFSVVNNGRYFLIANLKDDKPFQWFRVDYMLNARIEDKHDYRPLPSFEGMKDFDISEYLNQNVYLLSSESITATLLIEKESSVQYIVDWFKKNAKIYKKDDQIFADITCNENALFYWYMQYSEDFKIIAPKTLVKRVKQEASNIVAKYKGVR